MKNKIRPSLLRLCALLLLCGLLLPLAGCRKDEPSGPLDYRTADLTPYLKVDPASYRGKALSVGVPSVTDTDVSDRILKLRAEHKAKTPLFDGAYLIGGQKVSCGDEVFIYYRGYLPEDPQTTVGLFSQMSNFAATSGSAGPNPTPYELEIGSGSFVSGFESGLIGKDPRDYEKFSPVSIGAVQATDRAVITYTVEINTTSPEKLSYTRTAFVDLNDPAIEEIYGVGFAANLAGKSIGITSGSLQLPLPTEGEEYILYSSICVNFVFRASEKKPITVEAHFPEDYDEPQLAGKTVLFDVYIAKFQAYEAPEVNEAFLTETLAVPAEKLPAEGTAEEKLRAYVKGVLEEERREKALSLLEEAMWNTFKEVVKIDKYPEDEINRIYVQNKKALTEAYQKNITAYGSLDEFILSYFGLGLGDDWETYMRDEIRDEVGEEMILYSLLKAENLLPNDDQLAASYAACLEETYLEYEQSSGKNRAAYESDEAYEEAKAATKKNLENYYGTEYFTQGAYYEFATDGLLALFDLYVSGEKFSLK